MKKILIIIIAVLCIALPNFASDDNLIYNPKTQQWEYNLSELKFEYDNTGKLQKIGDMKVTYLENGQMDYIGDLKVKYFKNGRLKSVGKYWFNYGSERLESISHIGFATYYQSRLLGIGKWHINFGYTPEGFYRIIEVYQY